MKPCLTSAYLSPDPGQGGAQTTMACTHDFALAGSVIPGKRVLSTGSDLDCRTSRCVASDAGRAAIDLQDAEDAASDLVARAEIAENDLRHVSDDHVSLFLLDPMPRGSPAVGCGERCLPANQSGALNGKTGQALRFGPAQHKPPSV